MDKFSEWAQKEYHIFYRIMASLVAGFIFVFVIPYYLVLLSGAVERWWNIPRVHYHMINYVLGALIILVGLFFAVWSAGIQVLKVRGTPLPMMPTKRLLISGPFKYCRNPMSFGILMHYLGIAVRIGSISGVIIVILCALLLILYIKRVEEKELEIRFGQEYRDYKRITPFLFPRITPKER